MVGLRPIFGGIRANGSIVPPETLVYLATESPVVRAEVVKRLVEMGYLSHVGLEPVSWWRRLFRRALPEAKA